MHLTFGSTLNISHKYPLIFMYNNILMVTTDSRKIKYIHSVTNSIYCLWIQRKDFGVNANKDFKIPVWGPLGGSVG